MSENIEKITTRKDFIKKGFFTIGSLLLSSELLNSCTTPSTNTGSITDSSCTIAPTETKGPFPIKTPSELINSNIVSDRTGIALLVKIKIQDTKNGCKPIEGALVDIWHCDKDGYYSEYGATQMQQVDYTNVHFLRGRQTTDKNGEVQFISIYPGWYRGRAPHIHVEVLSNSGSSLVITQIAFPEDVSSIVYSSPLYSSHGQADTKNNSDNVFSDSLTLNMGSITGNVNDGFVLTKSINI